MEDNLSRSRMLSPRHGLDEDLMSAGTINVVWIPQVYWIFVGSVIAAFALVALVNAFIFRQRLHALQRKDANPAAPTLFLSNLYATGTAITREASNYSIPSARFNIFTLQQPSFGPLALVLGNLVLLVVLCFYKIPSGTLYSWQNRAYRCGFVSLGQLPLIFLLSSKRNVIGLVTGFSYERLNWLHRWCARCLLVTVTLHMAMWFATWAPYDGYIAYQVRTNDLAKTGIGAWCVLVWIVLSSVAPIRGLCYEFFVVQHVLSFTGLIAVLYKHLPDPGDQEWLWACVAIFFLDRVARALVWTYTNLSIFHAHRSSSGLLTCKAEMVPLGKEVTKVSIRNPPVNWSPGQHVFVSCHSILPFQSHPFTISSLPQDGVMEFLIRAHRGGTNKFFEYAESHNENLPSSRDAQIVTSASVAIEGPYGKLRPLRQFDSVVLVAGSIGATFTIPLLRDLIQQWKTGPACTKSWLSPPSGAVTRRLRFVWVVRSRDQVDWFSAQLSTAMDDVLQLQKSGHKVELDISVYVTCDTAMTEDWHAPLVHASSAAPQRDALAADSSDSLDSFASDSSLPEKKDAFSAVVTVQETDTPSTSACCSSEDAAGKSTSAAAAKGCQPDGTCCCTSTVNDEKSDAITPVCTCNGHAPSTSSSSRKPSQTDAKPHEKIAVLSGRPHVRNLTRRVLERATGETAVVCCGPKGLIEDTRRSVVLLSDERAVHKGTGALGVWFHGEGYGY